VRSTPGDSADNPSIQEFKNRFLHDSEPWGESSAGRFCGRRSNARVTRNGQHAVSRWMDRCFGKLIVLECFLPLSTAVKIGADEDFELSKAVLCDIVGHSRGQFC